MKFQSLLISAGVILAMSGQVHSSPKKEPCQKKDGRCEPALIDGAQKKGPSAGKPVSPEAPDERKRNHITLGFRFMFINQMNAGVISDAGMGAGLGPELAYDFHLLRYLAVGLQASYYSLGRQEHDVQGAVVISGILPIVRLLEVSLELGVGPEYVAKTVSKSNYKVLGVSFGATLGIHVWPHPNWGFAVKGGLRGLHFTEIIKKTSGGFPMPEALFMAPLLAGSAAVRF